MAGHGVDVLVIGGGITGAGVALDAASRGFRVGLVEQGDFAQGTSSRSTKLVHGGLRYVPQFDLGLVGEALHERARLIENAPHLVRPLPFVVPLYDDLRRPLGMRLPAGARPLVPLASRIGLWAYDALAGRGPVARHRALDLREALAMVPYLRRRGLRGALLYYDAGTDDVRLTLAVLRTAARFGALCVNYARAVRLVRQDGRISGAEVEDLLEGRSYSIPARWVVNAAGVWADRVARMAGGAPLRLMASRGVHLVLPAELVGISTAALVLPETEDGRLAFVVPWEGRAVLGTTDTPYEGPLDAPPVTANDVAFLLRQARRFLEVQLDEADVLGAYAGLRPLVGEGSHSADVSRRHAVVRHEPGLLSIFGGKLTTYRRMAQDVVDVIAREAVAGAPATAPAGDAGSDRHAGGTRAARYGGGRGTPRERPAACRTHTLTLVGGEEPQSWQGLLRDAVRAGVLPPVARRLVATYGAELRRLLELGRSDPHLLEPLTPEVPYLGAEVVLACHATMAVRLADVMDRRLHLAVTLADGGLGVAARVADLMAAALGWTAARRDEELEHYRSEARGGLRREFAASRAKSQA